ncbi:MAG: hypothetical protein OEV15_08560 [Gallionella sp.]|nr:hypothetical protein [Gallionella sp.]
MSQSLAGRVSPDMSGFSLAGCGDMGTASFAIDAVRASPHPTLAKVPLPLRDNQRLGWRRLPAWSNG